MITFGNFRSVSRMADDLFQRFDGDPRYGDATREWWEKYPGV